MGDDVTLEHLLAKKLKGGNNYGNLRVAHGKCNGLVGHLSVEIKLALHRLGLDQGSDAFFLEVGKLHLKSKKTKNRKHNRRARAAQAALLAVGSAAPVEQVSNANGAG